MGLLSLLKVASMPSLQLLMIGMVGAFMATDRLKLLLPDARSSMNKIVYVAFTPSLVFANLAKSVTIQDIVSWWFMPVNIGITFVVGGAFGWVAAKIVREEPHIQDLVIAMCSTGNYGYLLLIMIPAICKENGSPFGDKNVCSSMGLSYVSFSMAMGSIYIWTCTFRLIRRSSVKYKAFVAEEELQKEPNNDLEAEQKVCDITPSGERSLSPKIKRGELCTNGLEIFPSCAFWTQVTEVLHQIGKELLAPPITATILGLIFGTIAWLRNLIIGENAPLKVINDSIILLGDGTIPCITLVLGGNLLQGLRKTRLKSRTIIAVICVRYIILPIIGIFVVKAISHLGFLPSDPLYRFILMIQFTIPPGMAISTMTQLFDVAQEECSTILFWTYLVAVVALAGWSTVFMWILS